MFSNLKINKSMYVINYQGDLKAIKLVFMISNLSHFNKKKNSCISVLKHEYINTKFITEKKYYNTMAI